MATGWRSTLAADCMSRQNPAFRCSARKACISGVIPTPRAVISLAFSGPDRKTLYAVGSGALGSGGEEFTTPPGVRNNAKTIYKIRTLAQGFQGRVK